MAFFWVIWIHIFFSDSLTYACTGFMMSDGDKVLVGNNEDYYIPHTRVWFIPAENGQYGRIYFGYENWFPQGGMNDQGLFFDFFATKPLEVEKSKDKPKFPGSIIDTMAGTCATVEDVIEMFSQYNLEFMKKFQMFIVDKTGDAAIIEGDEIVRKTGSYQIVTGFHQSRVTEENRPCRWNEWGCKQYKITDKMIAENDTPTVAHYRNILEATHRDTTKTKTLYSNIYDLKKGIIYLYYMHDFDNEVVIDLNEELKKGRHYYVLPTMFGKDQKYGFKTYKNASPKFSISYPEHFKVNEPEGDEVLRLKCPFSGTPLFIVIVDDKPPNVDLVDIWDKQIASEVEEFASDVKFISSKQTKLRDGTPAIEIRFEWVSSDKWPLQTIVLAAYYQQQLVITAITTLAHPEFFYDFLYSLSFE